MCPAETAVPTGIGSVPVADLPFRFNDSAMIPVAQGQAVTPAWPEAIGGRPLGVTWHWTVTWDLRVCRQVLGGANAERKGQASAHYGVGRSFAEGVDRYVALENRSWHAGINQTLRWDGKALTDPDYKGSRSTVGVETVNIGYATSQEMAKPDWIHTAGPDGRPLRVQPWTEEQVRMMIEVGREIQRRWPHLRPEDHHGHHDVCPGYKVDVSGFPFARVLRGIYPEASIYDVWTPTATVVRRQRALAAAGCAPGAPDGVWGKDSAAALKRFQAEHGLVANGYWSTFVSRRLHAVLAERGIDLAAAAGQPGTG